MIKSIIYGGGSERHAAEVDDPGTEAAGLVVATRDLKSYRSYYQYFYNEVFGIEMNQKGASSGVPERVYDGKDSTLWDSRAVGSGITIVPYAQWHLNSTSGTSVVDTSGNARHGTTQNMEDADWVVGKLNNCLLFDGVNEWVNCGNIAGFTWDNSFSLECWFKTTTIATSYIFSKWTANIGYYVRMAAGKIEVVLQSGVNRRAYLQTNTLYNDNNWHHIIFTYSGSRTVAGMIIYLDGLPSVNTTIDDDLNGNITNAANFQISGVSGVTTPWVGSLDECTIYGSTLSQEVVTVRYNAGAGRETFPGWNFSSGEQNHTIGGSKSLGGTNLLTGNIVQLANRIIITHSEVVKATEPSFILSDTTDGQRIALYHGDTVSTAETYSPNEKTFLPTVRTGSLDLTNYYAVSGWIYIVSWSLVGVKNLDLYGFNITAGIPVGVAANIGNYVDKTILNRWQKFLIPLTDLDLAYHTIQGIRIAITSSGGGSIPSFYLDDIQFEKRGLTQAIEYTIEPLDGQWLHIEKMRLFLADNVPTTLADATMPALSYDDFLGIDTLESGIVFQRIQNYEITDVSILHNISDFFQYPNSKLDVNISDGVNTFIIIGTELPCPEVLKFETKDKLRITIRDDLTPLLQLRIMVSGRREIRIG